MSTLLDIQLDLSQEVEIVPLGRVKSVLLLKIEKAKEPAAKIKENPLNLINGVSVYTPSGEAKVTGFYTEDGVEKARFETKSGARFSSPVEMPEEWRTIKAKRIVSELEAQLKNLQKGIV